MGQKRKQPEARFAPLDIVQIGVRLEERLRRRLERAATQSGQSMNAEIVERLKRSFQSDEDKISLIARAIVDTYPDIANRIEELFSEARLWRQVKDMPGWKREPEEAEATAEAKLRALTDIPYDLALTLIQNYLEKKGWPPPESFSPIIELLIKNAEGRKAEGAQEAEKAASSVLSRLKQANREKK